MVKDAGPIKYVVRRAKGVRWDRWHRMVVMRSLEMMVMNGVVRRAEVDPSQHLDDCAGIETDPDTEASVSISVPSGIVDEQSWFTRFFRRRTDSSLTHARHTTWYEHG